MKLLLALVTLSAWCTSKVFGAGFSTCDEQARCINVKRYKSPFQLCDPSPFSPCDAVVCIEVDYSKPNCAKPASTTIDHICTKNPLLGVNTYPKQCQATFPNFVSSDKANDVPDKVKYCVTVPVGDIAYFLMGDGGLCNAVQDIPNLPNFSSCLPTDSLSYNGILYNSDAMPPTEIESCSSNVDKGKECIWLVATVDINECDNLPIFNYPLADTPVAGGDPHFRTWHGQKYNYHGACDLVLMHSDMFGSGFGMDIHIRTNRRGQFSYITAAALRIGDEVLEVTGQDGGTHILNVALPAKIAGHKITYNRHSDVQQTFLVHLHNKQTVVIKTWRDLVSVSIEHGRAEDFGDAVGLMGHFASGQLRGRDGHVMEDVNAFGQQWQVRENEPKLFQTLQSPQHPQECVMPPAKVEKRRRLGEGITEAVAKAACAHVDADDFDFCVYDVMATNDLTMVGAY
jgi:hypothetical protein